MSCQKKIVEKIIKKKADYAIGLKQNQPALYKDTEDYFNEFCDDIPMKSTLDKRHGRIEKREYQLLTELSWLEQKDEWEGLKGLGCVKSTVTETMTTTIPHMSKLLLIWHTASALMKMMWFCLWDYGYTVDEVEELMMVADALKEAVREIKFTDGEYLYENCGCFR